MTVSKMDCPTGVRPNGLEPYFSGLLSFSGLQSPSTIGDIAGLRGRVTRRSGHPSTLGALIRRSRDPPRLGVLIRHSRRNPPRLGINTPLSTKTPRTTVQLPLSGPNILSQRPSSVGYLAEPPQIEDDYDDAADGDPAYHRPVGHRDSTIDRARPEVNKYSSTAPSIPLIS